jgi:cation transport ATPase
MKKTFKLEGLDCANCAAKIQDGISQLDSVSSAAVNCVTTKLMIEGDDDKMEKIIEAAKSVLLTSVEIYQAAQAKRKQEILP